MENKEKIERAVSSILVSIEGSIREETRETPRRVREGLEEMLNGYSVDIEGLFKTSDGEGRDQIVVVRDIESWSVCEHHLLPFHIKAHVAYLPSDRVIGVSKVERLVHAYAHRLQLQERITRQVADAIMGNLQPLGVAVVVRGEHLCMKARGVRDSNSQVVSSVMLGLFREDSVTKQEVLSLLKEGV